MSKLSHTFIALVATIIIVTSGHGEILYSTKYGFIAESPSKPEKVESLSPTGDSSSFIMVSKNPRVLLTIRAQKLEDFSNFKQSSPKLTFQKALILANLSAAEEAENLQNVKVKWCENTSLPILKVSCSQVGLLKKDTKSYEFSYWMLINNTFYVIRAQGLDATYLEKPLQNLYESFMIVDSKALKELLDGAKNPASS